MRPDNWRSVWRDRDDLLCGVAAGFIKFLPPPRTFAPTLLLCPSTFQESHGPHYNHTGSQKQAGASFPDKPIGSGQEATATMISFSLLGSNAAQRNRAATCLCKADVSGVYESILSSDCHTTATKRSEMYMALKKVWDRPDG
jgi:hypothetical protein